MLTGVYVIRQHRWHSADGVTYVVRQYRVFAEAATPFRRSKKVVKLKNFITF
jgi:hypothetical protein